MVLADVGAELPAQEPPQILRQDICKGVGDDGLVAASKKWFAVTLSEGDEMPAFPSSNILALIFQQYEGIVSNGNKKRNYKVALDTKNWDIVCHKNDDGRSLYKASFVNYAVPPTPIFGRGKNKLPKWIKKNSECITNWI